MKAKLQGVIVEWLDPMSHNGWLAIEDAKEIVLESMWALGWLVQSDKSYIKVSVNKSASRDRVSDILILPRSCVKYIGKISVAKE